MRRGFPSFISLVCAAVFAACTDHKKWDAGTVGQPAKLTSADPARPSTRSQAQARFHAIYIDTPNGWQLIVGESGGGTIGYGSSGPDFTSYAAHTFDFEQLLGVLLEETAATDQNEAGYRASVNFMPRDGSSGVMKVIEDFSLIRALFQTAHDAADKSHSREPELWKERPPSTRPY